MPRLRPAPVARGRRRRAASAAPHPNPAAQAHEERRRRRLPCRGDAPNAGFNDGADRRRAASSTRQQRSRGPQRLRHPLNWPEPRPHAATCAARIDRHQHGPSRSQTRTLPAPADAPPLALDEPIQAEAAAARAQKADRRRPGTGTPAPCVRRDRSHAAGTPPPTGCRRSISAITPRRESGGQPEAADRFGETADSHAICAGSPSDSTDLTETAGCGGTFPSPCAIASESPANARRTSSPKSPRS